MWTKAPLLAQIVASSVSIARKAGQVIRATSGQDLKIIQKGYKDFQTEADRAAQLCIVKNLTRRFSAELRIVGEEDQDDSIELQEDRITDETDTEVLQKCEGRLPKELETAVCQDMVVWVDPLDGTSEFTEGLFDHVTVLIGIAVKGEPVAGVIHQPFYGYDNPNISPNSWGRTVWGVRGIGAFGLATKTAPKDKRIITTTRSHSDKLVNSAIEALHPDEVLRVGGAGHKVMVVIEGLANAYVFASAGCKKWDTCAPTAVLEAMGGRLTDLSGNELRYYFDVQRKNSGGVLATPPGADHAWFVSQIPESVKQALPPVIT